nr:unnamed protein product [Callosobruchus chinensis]
MSNAKICFKENRLTLNNTKTVDIVFTLKQLEEQDTEFTKFLGVYVDSKLRWNVHIDETAKKLTKRIFLLRNLSSELSSDALKSVYFSLCRSILCYIMLWEQAADWQRLFALQRKAVRIISGIGYTENCREKFVEHQVLTLPSVYIIYELLKYAKQYLTDDTIGKTCNSYNTRNLDQIQHVPFMRLSKSKKTFRYLAPQYFNHLPMEIKAISFHSFKRTIKNFLTEKACYSHIEFMDFKF